MGRLLGNIAMGGGRSGGLSVSGKVEGSSRSKSPGCSSMGSSGDKSSGVYCGGGPVSYDIGYR